MYKGCLRACFSPFIIHGDHVQGMNYCWYGYGKWRLTEVPWLASAVMAGQPCSRTQSSCMMAGRSRVGWGGGSGGAPLDVERMWRNTRAGVRSTCMCPWALPTRSPDHGQTMTSLATASLPGNVNNSSQLKGCSEDHGSGWGMEAEVGR